MTATPDSESDMIYLYTHQFLIDTHSFWEAYLFDIETDLYLQLLLGTG